MSVAAASDAERVGFGPFDEVLETEDGFGDECPAGCVGYTFAPVAEDFVGVDLGCVSWSFVLVRRMIRARMSKSKRALIPSPLIKRLLSHSSQNLPQTWPAFQGNVA